MSFQNSKYKEEYRNAQNLIRDFGQSNISIVRKNVGESRRPIYGEDNIRNEETINDLLSGVIFPNYVRENITNIVGNYMGIFVLNNQNLSNVVNVLNINDELNFGDKKYIIKEIKELNPDGNFPIIFELGLI